MTTPTDRLRTLIQTYVDCETFEHSTMAGLLPRFLDEFEERGVDLDHTDRLNGRLGRLLSKVAQGVKGPPPEGVLWGWDDLPREVARWRVIVDLCLEMHGFHAFEATVFPPGLGEQLQAQLDAERVARKSRTARAVIEGGGDE